MSDSKALEVYDVVFAGKLVGCFTDGDVSFTKYSVDRIWKGEVKEFYTSLVTPECRMDWLQELVGKDILIFAKYVDGSPHIQRPSGLCQPGGLLALTRIQRHLFGFPLPQFFDVQGPPESLDRFGPPIHTFN
ncbi:MAG: hypothetical protein COA45_10235 [Zetaproteobacteria bacterium]|nr:MAG: hypothetical protein COA45_10235 [Zetaproteobacteria bacterium]